MIVLIVENEKPAAERLIEMLMQQDETLKVVQVTQSVEETVNWLIENPLPDLVFMDIRLDDGICFEIFESYSLDVPVIFTTAYNEYMVRAFKVNSIDYLLKPITKEDLAHALDKFRRLHMKQSNLKDEIQKAIRDLQHSHRNRFLVKIGPRFKSVPTSEVCAFIIRSKETYLRTREGREYGIDFSLDRLEELLEKDKFFRINRTCIVNASSIKEMHSFSSSRLKLELENSDDEDHYLVSRERVSEFKRWMDT